MRLRYGMNPHQGARVVPSDDAPPLRVLRGEPSYINLLDALTGWQLVREASAATGTVAAASVKHVSPAGAALAGELDDTARQAWGLDAQPAPLTVAYVRARDADPRSSFGDMIAVSAPVDTELAGFLARVASDGIIAPGFEPGVAGVLAAKKHGTFLVLEIGLDYLPPALERRDVFGLQIEQERDRVPITADLLRAAGGRALPAGAASDALLGLVTLRHTQSNSVALVKDGVAMGIGAGQQNRVGCVKLAAAKAAAWWLRRHPHIRGLPAVPGMSRQDRLNWQLRMAEADMTPGQVAQFARLFPGVSPSLDAEWRQRWLDQLTGVTLASDGFIPFRDNIDQASTIGVRYVVEPGGSSRSGEVQTACAEYGMTLVRTGVRLFRH
jgi:phosphoribosylaminoimidazolecarboxamide formyltransferase / IMP cyclohydrolase